MTIPVVPKMKILSVGSTPILLHDFVLATAILIGLLDFIARASISGIGKIGVPSIAVILLTLYSFKLVVLGLLALFVPWVGPDGLGHGVMIHEGVLVLGRSTAFVLVFLLAVNNLHRWEDVYFVLRWFKISTFTVVGIALAQHFILDHPMLTSTFRNIYALSIIDPDGNWGVNDPWFDSVGVGHEQLGAFMVLCVSVFGGMLLCRWPANRMRRGIIMCLFLGCVFTLIFSASRGAWVGAVMSLAAFLLLAIMRRKTLYFIAVLCIGVISMALVDSLLELHIVDLIERRAERLPSVFSDEITDDSAKARFSTFRILWGIFEDNFLFGLGLGAAGRIAEGQYIRELVEGGLIGASLFVLLMITIGRYALRASRFSHKPLVQGLGIGFLCGLIGLCGQMFFSELLVLPKISVPFLLLAAAVYRLVNLADQSSHLKQRSVAQ